jgi:nicotinamide-nucleotide amidase
MIHSKIISIGDELLIGQIQNTNASFISNKLYSTGFAVDRIVTIGDNEDALNSELEDSLEKYDVTIITGGLGPTHDDLTKPILTKFFEDELVTDEKVLEHIKSFFANRNIIMPESNYEQALVPKKSKIIWNANGTAPGIWIEKDNRVFIALPGVPHEMMIMIDNYAIDMLKEKFSGEMNYHLKSKTILTTGIGESVLAEKIGDVKLIIGESKLAFLPSPYGVRLRIDVTSESENEVKKKILNIENKLKEKIGQYIYGFDSDLMEQIVGNMLIEKGLCLSVAESCTGGLISTRLTDISGSSKYFFGGVCTYSNESKIKILGIDKSILEKYGAVSEEIAKEMADKVKKKFNADIGISTTGIAGPTGGTFEKSVGLVYIGYSDNNETYAVKYYFGDNRNVIRIRASQAALDLIRRKQKINL